MVEFICVLDWGQATMPESRTVVAGACHERGTMFVIFVAILLACSQAPSQEQPQNAPHIEAAAPVDLRFKAAAGERLKYRIRGDSLTGKELEASKCEADIILTVMEHTADRITAEMAYERVKLIGGEGVGALAYDSAEKPKDAREEIVAAWIKPILARKFTVVCDGGGALETIEGMSPNIFEAMADSPLSMPEGKEQIRRVGNPGAAVVAELVKLKSGEMMALVALIFQPGHGAPQSIATGETWDDKDSRTRFAVESVQGDIATIRLTELKAAPLPAGEQRETSGQIEWATQTGTLVRAASRHRVLKSSGGAGSITAGTRSEWKVDRLPNPLPSVQQQVPPTSTTPP